MKEPIFIICGGQSAEHEVSLLSAQTILQHIDKNAFIPIVVAIDKQGYWWHIQEEPFFIQEPTAHKGELKKINMHHACPIGMIRSKKGASIINLQTHQILYEATIAFNIIHGTNGEDGNLQGFLEIMNIAYVGPTTLGSAIGMDKDITKKLLQQAGIPITPYICIHHIHHSSIQFNDAINTLKTNTLFIKPANSGSSVGISKVTTEDSFKKALNLAFQYDKKVLIEKNIQAREIECGVIGNSPHIEASPLGELIAPSNTFYTFDEKYAKQSKTKEIIPTNLPLSLSNDIRNTAIRAYELLECSGLTRIDFFVESDNSFMINEINTLPGFTVNSIFPRLMQELGYNLPSLITKLIQLAIERKKQSIKHYNNSCIQS